MFDAEAAGLRELQSADAIRIPAVYASGVSGPVAWLALEWLDFDPATDRSQALLGERLAALHRITSDAHGWHRDNTIGSTPQINEADTLWWRFYRERRLRYQLDLAARYGYTGRLQSLGDALLETLPSLLAGHDPPPSLLHGDLWGGNQASVGGEPVIFDPAVYYGDRETDIAMARLFGGFSNAFHTAYEAAWPLPDGHERRLGLYQLYHLLNHLNLFGRSYLGRAEGLIESLLSG